MKSVPTLLRSTLLLCALSSTVHALEPHTEHTFRLSEGESPPAATLEDAAWLAGSWTGTAFGKRFEEVWNPPSAGSMVGLFKLYDDQGVTLYELLQLKVDDEGRLSLKVKHFSSDFIAWEEKDDFVNFRLVGTEDDALHFHGISFYRRGEDRIDGYIVMQEGDELSEQKLEYRRVPAGD